METTVILGGGESGRGTALLAQKQGHEVFLSDSGTLADRYREALELAGVGYEEGGHDKVLCMHPTQVVKSPGIPDSAAVVRHFAEQGVPVISEIEFAAKYSRGRTICITGSNGKTTTATLTYEMLRAAGRDVALSGNIGNSYAGEVAAGDHDWYVLEISSFQLDGMCSFRADVALLLNITPDHLDRYGYSMDNYAASKMRIAANQRPGDFFIYNGSDELIARRPELALSPAVKLPFSLEQGDDGGTDGLATEPPEGGACLDGEDITVSVKGRRFTFPVENLGIKGRHNIANAMAASLAAMAAGVDGKHVAQTLAGFRGVEHRMEDAGEVDGVRFVNDSKATNTDAAWYALDGTPGPVVWIAGGTDKGNDYTELKKVAAGKVHTLVCMGIDNRKLVENFTGVVPRVIDTHSLDQAMLAATAAARPGDTVLLSPACASFDLFLNYEQRGTLFKEWIAGYMKSKNR